MTSAQSIWAFVFALGSVQGLFLGSTLIFLRSTSRTATTLLGLLVLTFTFNIAEEFVEAAQLIDTLPHVLLGTLTLPLMMGPLLFLYGQCLTQKRKSIRKKDYIHFLPFMLTTLYFLPFYLQSGDAKLVSMRQGIFSDEILLLATIKGAHLFIYFGAALYMIHLHVKRKESLDQPHHLKILWYRRLLHAMIIVLLITGMLYYATLLSDRGLWDSDYVASLLLTLIIYTYAFIAIKHPGSLSDVEPLGLVQPKEPSSNNGSLRYQTSPIDAGKRQHYLRLLLNHMETARPYLDSDLSRDDIARTFSISAHNVSQIINEELEVNFYEFINRYRVEEVKRKLGAGEQAQKTLLAIAFEAGFTSKSSFNRVFKQHTGMTPTQYISQLT